MIRPIDYVINYIKLRIPKEILELGFIRGDIADDHTTLEDKIRRNVIAQHILPDLNLMGGPVLHVDLRRCKIQRVNHNSEFIIHVPKELTDNLSIIKPLHLTARYLYAQQREFSQGRCDPEPVSLAYKMVNALKSQPMVNTTNIELIGDNIIAVHEPLNVKVYNFLQVIVENKENLSNINPEYDKYLAELCLEATKMFIYTNTIINLNQGYIQGGHEISSIRDHIEEYKESMERYNELLLDWRKIAVLNDKQRMNKFVKLVTGNSV